MRKKVVNQIYDDYIQMTCDDECGTFDLALLDRLEKIKSNYFSKPIIRIDDENDMLILATDISKLTEKMSAWQNLPHAKTICDFSSLNEQCIKERCLLTAQTIDKF